MWFNGEDKLYSLPNTFIIETNQAYIENINYKRKLTEHYMTCCIIPHETIWLDYKGV